MLKKKLQFRKESLTCNSLVHCIRQYYQVRGVFTESFHKCYRKRIFHLWSLRATSSFNPLQSVYFIQSASCVLSKYPVINLETSSTRYLRIGPKPYFSPGERTTAQTNEKPGRSCIHRPGIPFRAGRMKDLIAWPGISQRPSPSFRWELRYWFEDDSLRLDKCASEATRGRQADCNVTSKGEGERGGGEKSDKITRWNRGFAMSRGATVSRCSRAASWHRATPKTTHGRVVHCTYVCTMSSKFMQRSWLWYRIFLHTDTRATTVYYGAFMHMAPLSCILPPLLSKSSL